MNENLKNLLMSENEEDVKLGLEICKRENVTLLEVSNVYKKVINETFHNAYIFYTYLFRNPRYGMWDNNSSIFYDWKNE